MTQANQTRILSFAVAAMCALQLFDAASLFSSGHRLAGVAVSLAALVGTSLGLWSGLRRASPAIEAGDAASGSPGKTWNLLINGGFLCYFLIAIVMSFFKPQLAGRILHGAIGAAGLIWTFWYAIRTLRKPKQAVS